MDFFEEDEELKKEIEEEVQRLKLEERKVYVHSRALEILSVEKRMKNKETMKQDIQNKDFYIQFIEETIIKTGNKEDTVDHIDIYQHFYKWFRDHFPSLKCPTLYQMNTDLQLSVHLGNKPSGKRYWVGYSLKI
jgi:hypothetical protein